MRPVARSPRFVLLLAVLLLAGPGCFGRASDDDFEATPPDPALDGKFFASAGDDYSLSADLYEVRFNPLRLYRLSDTTRVFGPSACPSQLVVSISDQTVGFGNALRSYDGRSFEPLPGLEDQDGAIPYLDPDCRVLFSQFDRSTDPPTDALQVYEPETALSTRVHAGVPGEVTLGAPAWGPDGRIAVLEVTAPVEGQRQVVTGLVLIARDGSKRTVAAPVDELVSVDWAPSDMIAFGYREGGTVFFQPDTGERVELAGWVPLGWSPDGARMLVADAETRRTIGLVERSDLTSVREIATAQETGIFEIEWLPSDAPAGGAVTLGAEPDDGEARRD